MLEVLSFAIAAVPSLLVTILREVFRPAAVASAAAVVLIHNHPSGDPELSEADRSITRWLVLAGELLGITVLDHVIAAERGMVSLRARQQPRPHGRGGR